MTKEKQKETPVLDRDTSSLDERQLILMNDDVHTFDYVIDALIDICDHTYQQATQCTMIVHYKGSCDVKKGTLEELRPLRKALLNKELKATIR
ncbi:MAG TPA: ATP-dependent Clp protease adaptor ClpS [Prolixibacteraceae bacterium]|nr:ATP-dependent Clp protease adaptor ClpS [Prolixibacteraceae bacterium]